MHGKDDILPTGETVSVFHKRLYAEQRYEKYKDILDKYTTERGSLRKDGIRVVCLQFLPEGMALADLDPSLLPEAAEESEQVPIPAISRGGGMMEEIFEGDEATPLGEFDYKRDVAWVCDNLRPVVHWTSRGRLQLHWGKARSRPPSNYAMKLMEWAAKNEKNFMDLPQKLFSREEDADEETDAEKHDRLQVAEIKKILAGFVAAKKHGRKGPRPRVVKKKGKKANVPD